MYCEKHNIEKPENSLTTELDLKKKKKIIRINEKFYVDKQNRESVDLNFIKVYIVVKWFNSQDTCQTDTTCWFMYGRVV